MENTTRTERAVMLGLVALLGATQDLATSIAAVVISVIAIALVWACAVPAGRFSPGVRYAITIAVSFSASWVMGSITPFIAPIREQSVLFLQLIGVTPIVFLPASIETRVVDWARTAAIYLALLPAFGLVREFFGRGTVLGYLATPGFTTPAGLFASPIGAFLLCGAVVLGWRIIMHRVRRASDGRRES